MTGRSSPAATKDAPEPNPDGNNLRARRRGLHRLLPATIRGTQLFLLLVVLVPALMVQAAVYYDWFQTHRATGLQDNIDLLRSGGLLLLVVAAALLAALAAVRYITVPMDHLREHALALGRREPSKPLELLGPVELEQLADALNRMAG